MKTPLRLRLSFTLLVFIIVTVITAVSLIAGTRNYPHSLLDRLALSVYGSVFGLPAAALCCLTFAETTRFFIITTAAILLGACLFAAFAAYRFGQFAMST